MATLKKKFKLSVFNLITKCPFFRKEILPVKDAHTQKHVLFFSKFVHITTSNN